MNKGIFLILIVFILAGIFGAYYLMQNIHPSTMSLLTLGKYQDSNRFFDSGSGQVAGERFVNSEVTQSNTARFYSATTDEVNDLNSYIMVSGLKGDKGDKGDQGVAGQDGNIVDLSGYVPYNGADQDLHLGEQSLYFNDEFVLTLLKKGQLFFGHDYVNPTGWNGFYSIEQSFFNGLTLSSKLATTYGDKVLIDTNELSVSGNLTTDKNIFNNNLIDGNIFSGNIFYSDLNRNYGIMYCSDGNIMTGYLVGYSC